MALPIAVQVYSVRNEAAADLRGTLTQIKAMGYDGVEFAGLYDHEPAEVRALCDELGLVPISAHVGIDHYVKDFAGTINTYAAIGCRYVAIPHLSSARRPGGEQWSDTVEMIKSIGTALKEKGISLLYHNHDFEFVRLGDEYGLDQLYRLITPDLLGTELDTCWVKVAGEDPAAYIRKYAGRSPIVHLKDFVGQKTKNMYELIGVDQKAEETVEFEFRPVGYGVQNIPEILTAAKDAGAEWVVVEQDRATMGKTPLESIEMSIKYLRSLEW